VNDIRESVKVAIELKPPKWEHFFAERSAAAAKTAFQMLARGPRQRTDRKPRILKGGAVTDIYGAVLLGIAYTGPLTSLTYEGLRTALKEVLDGELPQRHEVTRVLEEMSKIARYNIESEPVVDYDESLSILHISDPYFAFYLRWRINSRIAPEAAERVSITQHVEGRDVFVLGGDFSGNVVLGDHSSGAIVNPPDEDDEP
jgi:CBS domain-containing protein